MKNMNELHQPVADIVVLDCSVFQDEYLYTKAWHTVDDTRKNKIINSRDEDRLTSLGVGCLTNHLLRKYGIETPLTFSEDGKPLPCGNSYYLSLSHAGHYAMAGLSSEPIGVDLESYDSPHDLIASHFFSPEEKEYLGSASDPAKAFFQLWSRKECMIKRDGLKDIRALPAMSAPEHTQFTEFPLDGYSCVAYLSEGISPRFQIISIQEIL